MLGRLSKPGTRLTRDIVTVPRPELPAIMKLHSNA